MDNTFENKSKFFALYFGQKVLKKDIEGLENFITEPDGFLRSPSEETYLELKPISSITDEDAIYIAKIENNYEDALVRGKVIIRTFYEFSDYSHIMKNSDQFLQMIDYLRSKGYAVSWMGLSVETLVEYGWIKLKEEL